MDKWKADVGAEALQVTAEFMENIPHIIGTSISNWVGFFIGFWVPKFWYKALARIEMLLLINAVSDYLQVLFYTLTATELCSMLQT